MDWLKNLFAQFKSKTVWGVLIIILVQITGLSSDDLTGIIDKFATILEALAYILTVVGINHKLEKWVEAIKNKTPA